MSVKRKRSTISIADKLTILDKLSKGSSQQQLANEYKVCQSTIAGIKKNEVSIKNYASTVDTEAGIKSRNKIQSSYDVNLDKILYDWFIQSRSIGCPLSGEIVQAKAKIFHEMLYGGSGFKASNGWLYNFQLRHGIRSLQFSGEKLSADLSAADKYKQTFADLIIEKGYTRENTYNADETGLLWKSLPNNSLAARNEKSVPGPKRSKERVTILFCSNAAGTNRLPVLLIGKSKNPRCFKHLECELPIVYRSQKNAWMDTKLFTDWFFEVFVPSARNHNSKNNLPDRALLLLDNAPVHPSIEALTTKDGKYTAAYLPPNVTSLIQPLDQSIIETFKRIYRRRLLRKLLLSDDGKVESILQFWKSYQLAEAAFFIGEAWDEVKSLTLKRGWNKLWPEEDEIEIEPNHGLSVETFQVILTDISGCSDCEVADVQTWLDEDNSDPGFRILNDDELVNGVQEADSDSETEDAPVVEEQRLHSDAVHACDSLLQWMGQQHEVESTQVLLVHRLRDLASFKLCSGLKQSKITKYFNKI